MPVYFEQAIERLALTLGPSTWLEAGSSSSVTAMASRALSSSIALSHTFQAIALGGTNTTKSLVDATLNFWKSGHKLHFWPHHRSQKHEYQMINLPPYQFEKSRHWLSWVDTTQTFTPVDTSEPVVEKERALFSLIGFRDKDRLDAEFSVDPLSKEYESYVRGHAVLAEPLCPAPLYVELVSRAAMVLLTEPQSTDYLPSVQDLEISALLGINTDRAISVEMKRTYGKSAAWTFELKSKSRSDTRESSSTHATGRVTLHRESPKLHTGVSRYERLIGYQKFDDLRLDPHSEILQGATVYKAFSRVVTYAEHCKGVRSVYGQGQQVAGLVSLPDCDQSALQKPITRPLAVDNFVQVAGLHVNCLNDCKDTQVYVCTQVESIQIGPKFKDSNSWFVYSRFTSVKDREVSNDIFVFDRESKNLVLIVLGARFMKVLISSLTKVLSRANPSQGLAENSKPSTAIDSTVLAPLVSSSNEDSDFLTASSSNIRNHPKTNAGNNNSSTIDIEIRKLLHRVTDVPIEDFKEDSTLEELGVDSNDHRGHERGLQTFRTRDLSCRLCNLVRHQGTTDLSSC